MKYWQHITNSVQTHFNYIKQIYLLKRYSKVLYFRASTDLEVKTLMLMISSKHKLFSLQKEILSINHITTA